MSSPQSHPAQVTAMKLLITDYSALFTVIIISLMRILCIKDLLRSPTNSGNAHVNSVLSIMTDSTPGLRSKKFSCLQL